MRIISPRGRILSVIKVTPFAERVDAFNGRSNICTETATDMSINPTGLRFELAGEKNVFSDAAMYIGNFTPEKVCEIQRALLQEGIYDFSSMKYQKNIAGQNVVIDAGVSLPYFTENELFSGWDGGFNLPVSYRPKEQEDEDLDDDNEEDD